MAPIYYSALGIRGPGRAGSQQRAYRSAELTSTQARYHFKTRGAKSRPSTTLVVPRRLDWDELGRRYWIDFYLFFTGWLCVISG